MCLTPIKLEKSLEDLIARRDADRRELLTLKSVKARNLLGQKTADRLGLDRRIAELERSEKEVRRC